MKIKKTFVFKTVSFLALLLTISFATVAQDEISTDKAVISAGEALYEDNCTACHAMDSKVIGPALNDAHKRNNVAWLKAFIVNSQKVIQGGDEYAVKLYKEYNKTQMNSHDFNDEELNAVIAFIKDRSENPLVAEVPVADANGTTSSVVKEDSGINNVLIVVIAVVLVILLVVLLLMLKVIKNIAVRKGDLDEGDSYLVNQTFDIGAVLRSGLFKFIVGFLIVCIGGKFAIDFVMGIGIQQGYAPTQPIAYSHKLHAGSAEDGGHEIDCNYCHTGVRKSKNANIPSPNICMNCHSEIKKDSKKLQPLFDAVKNGTPIEWVRIHNLPDLAYFNHSQHVEVGGVECQTCHGPIETMEVVEQYADLTMGWCINCHRETEVNAKGNAYYDKLLEMHEDKTDEPMTVKDIGGMECSKCHY